MTTLKLGSRGTEVKTLQTLLHCAADGIFGQITLEAVKAFQSANGLTADGIVGPKTWAKLLEGTSTDTATIVKSKRTINKIIIHVSAVKPAQAKVTTVDTIRQWHLQRGFVDIGYHYVIYTDGTVHNGRDVDVIGAHTTGYNSYSIGICLNGGLDEDGNPADTRTPEQRESLIKLVKELKTLYPKATIHGHNEFAAKACPCFDVQKELDAFE